MRASTRSLSKSTPITSFPAELRHADNVNPTLPRPKTEIFILRLSRARYHVSRAQVTQPGLRAISRVRAGPRNGLPSEGRGTLQKRRPTRFPERHLPPCIAE